MNYRERERKNAINTRDSIFRDPGGGLYKNRKRDFVLSNPYLNLWDGIREDALEYFETNNISWWDSGKKPTGHLLSSQIACLNHLYYLRQRYDLATLVLQGIDDRVKKSIKIDTGFVEFEKVGHEKLGKETHLSRGANCTSIDAMMIGENFNGHRILFIIEWKYTELYNIEPKYKGKSGETRLEAYEQLLNAGDCPIIYKDKRDLYYEPFYQLMRQTLLGWEMVKRKEYNVSDWVHIHIIPRENLELKNKITSPNLQGNSVEDVWEKSLRQPSKYLTIEPDVFMNPIINCTDTKSLISYLKKRYW